MRGRENHPSTETIRRFRFKCYAECATSAFLVYRYRQNALDRVPVSIGLLWYWAQINQDTVGSMRLRVSCKYNDIIHVAGAGCRNQRWVGQPRDFIAVCQSQRFHGFISCMWSLCVLPLNFMMQDILYPKKDFHISLPLFFSNIFYSMGQGKSRENSALSKTTHCTYLFCHSTAWKLNPMYLHHSLDKGNRQPPTKCKDTRPE